MCQSVLGHTFLAADVSRPSKTSSVPCPLKVRITDPIITIFPLALKNLRIHPSRYEQHRRLDRRYTVFGEIFRGIELLDKIVATARDAADNPLEPITMTVTVKE